LTSLLKIILLSTVFFFTCLPNLYSAQYKSKIYNNHYRFTYQESDSILVRKLVEKSRPGIQLMEDFFKYKPESGIDIIVTKSAEEYHRIAEVNIPEWSQAIAFTRQGKIILNLSSAETVRSSPQILVHELSHIFLAVLYRDASIPVWMNEGLAQYFAREEIGFDEMRTLANALSSAKLMDLAALDTVLVFGPAKARLAYVEALSAIKYFISRHGSDALKTVLDELNNDKTPDEAFLQVTGADLIDFEIEWNKYLSDQYR